MLVIDLAILFCTVGEAVLQRRLLTEAQTLRLRAITESHVNPMTPKLPHAWQSILVDQPDSYAAIITIITLRRFGGQLGGAIIVEMIC